MTDLNELRRLAMAATKEGAPFAALSLFASAANPAAILELVERCERAEKALLATVRAYNKASSGPAFARAFTDGVLDQCRAALSQTGS